MTMIRETVYHLWKRIASDRTHIGELFCCLLELLDCTGWRDHNFDAALLYNDDESAVHVERGEHSNDWSRTIQDNHLTCAYAIINEQCLNCDVPNHSASARHIQHAYTVLETEFAADTSTTSDDNYDYKIRPNDQRLRLVDSRCGDIAMLGYVTNSASNFRRTLSNKPRDLVEICNPVDRWTRSVAFVRASKRSFHGKETPKQSTLRSGLNFRLSRLR